MCLAYIMKIVDQMDFHCVVFDTAPTGHTLRLLNFPSVLGKALEKLIQLKESLGGVITSVYFNLLKLQYKLNNNLFISNYIYLGRKFIFSKSRRNV